MGEFKLSDDLILNEHKLHNGLCKESKDESEILEWIDYDRFEVIKYLAEGGFETIYKATWKDGFIERWDSENNQWKRSKFWFEKHENFPVDLKCLHNSQDITSDFLREVYDADPLKRPKAKELYVLINDLLYNLTRDINHEIDKKIEEADKINEKFTQVSRLLDFKNLPESKNAIDNKDDDSSFEEYSESIKMDFTKLNLNSED
ncbi:kinase-like domain-containing protein [Rhizophagus clarus]|uniref:Kinase-like domain-containing protein n=1 Tax=Rhizophagus clarus TaxID=94130 RepID=A0A8H3L4C7_9GLOM|nr:kinase-like domain-containing protein [Rhizophagus clarus]